MNPALLCGLRVGRSPDCIRGDAEVSAVLLISTIPALSGEAFCYFIFLVFNALNKDVKWLTIGVVWYREVLIFLL
jgi:hypothetical protein